MTRCRWRATDGGESTVALGCVRGWGRAGREGRPKKANEMSCVERGDNGDGCGCDGVSGVYRAASRQLPRFSNRLKKSAKEEKSVLSFPPAIPRLWNRLKKSAKEEKSVLSFRQLKHHFTVKAHTGCTDEGLTTTLTNKSVATKGYRP